MNKKIVGAVVGVVLIVMVALLGKNYTDRKEPNKEMMEETESSFLTSTVLDITGQQLTLQDENNVIYTLRKSYFYVFRIIIKINSNEYISK